MIVIVAVGARVDTYVVVDGFHMRSVHSAPVVIAKVGLLMVAWLVPTTLYKVGYF